MNQFRFHHLAALVLLAVPLGAQQFTPHIGYVYPAGGRQGTTFEVTVGGQYIDGVDNAYVTGAGVEARVTGFTKLLTQGQANRLRDEMRELMERKSAFTKQQRKGGGETQAAKVTWTDKDDERIAEIRKKLAEFIRKPASLAIADTVRVQITIAANAQPGERELRLVTPAGMTNPLTFLVGQLPEYSKAPAKVSADPASIQQPRFARYQAPPPPRPAPAEVTLPVVINGQIASGGVDKYKFKATKGQHLVVAAQARELIPYISDAVPGWFQAALTLYDDKGKQVDYADHFRFHPDPVLYYEIAADGEYTLEIRDSIYRGREDFVYRITVGELPYLTSIFPLGGKAGARTNVELRGWNLPSSRLTQDSKGKPAGLYPISVRKGEVVSNRLLFTVDTLPETNEKESNNQIKSAAKVKLPIIVNGRIDRPGDVDVFRIDGQAGEEIVAEVLARRLESPLDSILRLTDASGKQLAVNDDSDDKGAGLLTHQADSLIRFKLPAKGSYYLHLADTQRKGGPEYAYRLRISRPQPDFDLRVVPASISARGGSTVPITVYALRRDGFDGDISLRMKDAPEGFTLSGGWIPAGQDKIRLTLSVPPNRIEKPRPLHLEGRGLIRGKEVTRAAVPAEDMMQAFAYRHLVAAKEWLVRVTPGPRGRTPWRAAAAKPVRLVSGGTTQVQVSAPLGQLASMVRLNLNEPPPGIAIEKVTPSGQGLTVSLRTDAAKAKPGLKGNLILDAFIEREQSGGNTKQAARRRLAIGVLPAIPFEVVTNAQVQARR